MNALAIDDLREHRQVWQEWLEWDRYLDEWSREWISEWQEHAEPRGVIEMDISDE